MGKPKRLNRCGKKIQSLQIFHQMFCMGSYFNSLCHSNIFFQLHNENLGKTEK